MEQKLRITLFVLLFSIGLILGLTFLNILEAKLSLLVAAGIVIGLVISLEKIEVMLWQHAVAAVIVVLGIALMAKGSLALSQTTVSMLFFVGSMLIAPVLVHIRSTFIKIPES